jgi:hypothetical protein
MTLFRKLKIEQALVNRPGKKKPIFSGKTRQLAKFQLKERPVPERRVRSIFYLSTDGPAMKTPPEPILDSQWSGLGRISTASVAANSKLYADSDLAGEALQPADFEELVGGTGLLRLFQGRVRV